MKKIKKIDFLDALNKIRIILTILLNYYDLKFEIVGSIRRSRQQVSNANILINDVRIKNNIIEEIKKLKNIKIISIKDNEFKFKIDNFNVNLYFCFIKEYGAQLLYYTGSIEFNTYCKYKAIRKGYNINKHGIFSGNKCLSYDMTEQEIMEKLLKIKYVKPEDR